MATVSLVETKLVASITNTPVNSLYMYAGSSTIFGQSFNTGSNGALLSSCQFKILKYGNPSGNMTASLYAHTGTFGTNSKPTGSALATSDVLVANDVLTTELQTITFNFATGYQMSDNTNYVITLNFSGGDSNNWIELGACWPSVGPGNYSIYNGSWYASNTYDFPFYVYGTVGSLSAKIRIKKTDITPYEEVLVRNYPESNYSSYMYLSSDEQVGIAQSFKPSNNCNLYKTKFYLKRDGSPTGTAVAKLYGHSGTYGTSSYPNGGVLATSSTLDVSTLTTGFSLFSFIFPTGYSMTSGTNYCIALEFSGGDYNNDVVVALDNTSPTADGNLSYANYANPTSWVSYSSRDLIFYVYSSNGSIRSKVRIKKIGSAKTATSKVKIQLAETKSKTSTSKVRIKKTRTLINVKDLIDSYDTDHEDSIDIIGYTTHYGVGQSFIANGGFLDSAKFYVEKVGSPTGDAVAKLYLATGTYGDSNTNMPTGTALAVSDVVNASTFSANPTLGLITFNFSGANRVALTNGQQYYITIAYPYPSPYTNSTNYIAVGKDEISSSHSGSLAESYWANDTWRTCGFFGYVSDLVFFVYKDFGGNIYAKVKIKSIKSKTVTAKTYILYARQVKSIAAKVIMNVTKSLGSTDVLIASYSETNYSSDTYMSGSERIKAAQSFSSGPLPSKLKSCKFYINKYGSPTGNAVATLYAHSGTFGTSSLPTGVALATSVTKNVALFSGSKTLQTFTFSGENQYLMSANTNYCIAIEYSGGNGSNDFNVYYDDTASIAPGNASQMESGSSTWTLAATRDYIHYIYADTGGITAKVNIFNVVNRTVTPKVRIKQLAREKTSESKLKIVYLHSNIVSAKAWIKGIKTRTMTSKVNIKYLGKSKSVSAKSKIVYLREKNAVAKIHIKHPGNGKEISAIVDISRIGLVQSSEAKTYIVHLVEQSISAKAYLVHLNNTYLQAKLAVKNTKEVSASSKIRIKIIDNTDSISAKTRIYKKYKLVKYSHFIGSHDNGSILTNSATFYPASSEDSSPWLYNSDHFNNQQIYFEFDITMLTGVTKSRIRLYDITAGEDVINSEVPVSVDGSYRTPELSLTTFHEYVAQAKVSEGSGYVRISRPRIFILQEDNQITKTETYFPISCAYTGFPNTAYKSLYPGAAPVPATTTTPKPDRTLRAKMFVKPASGKFISSKVHIKKLGETKTEISAANIYQGNGGLFIFNAAEWNGAVDFYLEAHFGSTGGRTNYIQLFDLTSNTVVTESEITSIGTATRQRSASFSLEDGKYYTIQTKSSSSGERSTCGEVRLIAYQNALGEIEKTITKTVTFYDLRLSTEEIKVSNTSYESVSKLDSGATTDHGFEFDYALDYESFSFYPKLFILGRKSDNANGNFKFKVHDIENTRDVTSEISPNLTYQAKEFSENLVDGSVLKDYHQKFVLYGHKEVGSVDAIVSLYGIYLGVQLKTRNLDLYSKVRISLDKDDFNTAVSSTIRKITGRLYVKWNGKDWIDESVYLISAKGNSQFSGRKGEIVADQCDFELDNVTQRFSRDNEKSEIKNYIKPNIEIKFEIGINGLYTKIFTGKIQSVDPNRQTGVVNFNCNDFTSKLTGVLAPTTLYTNKRFNEIVEILIQNCGLSEENYSLEESYNIAETVWFEDKTTNEILVSLVEAERGRLFFDASGNLVFWNARHFENQQPVASLSKNDWITNFHSKVDEQDIVNKITITSKPRKAQGIQVVWTNGNAVASDQYSDTLVWIPANSYQNAMIELDDPAIDWVTPVADYDYVANSFSDGTGTDLTDNITVDEFTTYEKQVFLTVTNNGPVDAFLTEFNIRANPLTVYKYIRTIYTDSASIAKYGTKDTTIENNWIVSDEMANEIKEAEVNANKEAINSYDLEMIGRPDVTAGELIAVETKKNNYNIFQVKQNDWTMDINGYVQSLELTEKEAITTAYEESYGIGSGIIGGGIVGKRARSRAKSKFVSAKVSIKRNISLTATARVRITT